LACYRRVKLDDILVKVEKNCNRNEILFFLYC